MRYSEAKREGSVEGKRLTMSMRNRIIKREREKSCRWMGRSWDQNKEGDNLFSCACYTPHQGIAAQSDRQRTFGDVSECSCSSAGERRSISNGRGIEFHKLSGSGSSRDWVRSGFLLQQNAGCYSSMPTKHSEQLKEKCGSRRPF